MKKEIIVLYGLYALIYAIGLCFLFKATTKSIGLSVFCFCGFISYNILKKISKIRAELKEYDDFLND